MRFRACWLFALPLVLGVVRPAFPGCGDEPGDAEAVAAVRAQAEATCPCATAASHGQYVRCVKQVANQAARTGQLPAGCRGAVARCAGRSTCGRPGALTCCRTTATGEQTCRTRRGAEACTAPPGGRACVAAEASCCDACGPGECAACLRDAECDDGNPCTQDTCTAVGCRHDCLCVGPSGTLSCCPGPAAECPRQVWFSTCGDPVCSIGGHRPHEGVRPCGLNETVGKACRPKGAKCDPGSDCNELLLCTTENPARLCPISRRRYKQNIRYLGADDLQRLHEKLMRHRLATYEYTSDPSRSHLGFVIEDVEPSFSVDAERDMVDLYGYASMAVAALQAQQREIEQLKRELAALRRQMPARTR